MATGSIFMDQVAKLIQEVYSGALAVALNQNSPIYQRLLARGRIRTDIRTELRWPVISGEFSGVTTIDDGERLPDPGREEYDAAVLKYKIVVATVRVGRLIQSGSRGPEFFKTGEGATLLEQQVNSAIRQMARKIHLQMAAQTKASAKDIECIGDLFGKNDNTYAGINRVGNAFWQPYVNDNAGVNRPLTIALLKDVHDTQSNDRGVVADEVWCGLTAWNALDDLLGVNVRQSDPSRLVGGPLSIIWRNLEFFQIPNLDPNAMFFLNFTTDGGIWLNKQHENDFITRVESTDSYDERMSIAGHYQFQVNNPFAQASLLDVN